MSGISLSRLEEEFSRVDKEATYIFTSKIQHFESFLGEENFKKKLKEGLITKRNGVYYLHVN